jgi:hypothetical protein
MIGATPQFCIKSVADFKLQLAGCLPNCLMSLPAELLF